MYCISLLITYIAQMPFWNSGAGGYDEGEEIEDALAFYSCQRWVGERIRAIGQWAPRSPGACLLCYSTGQCAKVDLAGFD